MKALKYLFLFWFIPALLVYLLCWFILWCFGRLKGDPFATGDFDKDYPNEQGEVKMEFGDGEKLVFPVNRVCPRGWHHWGAECICKKVKDYPSKQ